MDIDIPRNESFYDAYLKTYMQTLSYRDEYLHLLELSLYVPKSIQTIIEFLEKTLGEIESKKGYRDILQSFMQELFIYTVCFFLKYKLYKEIGLILGSMYYKPHEGKQAHSFSIFYNSEVLNICSFGKRRLIHCIISHLKRS